MSATSGEGHIRRGWLRALAALALVAAADQATKALVRADVQRGERRDLLLGLDLVHVRNRGIAFGLLADGGIVVALATGAALALLLFYFARHAARPGLWLATGLMLGGAAGNLVDRVRLGAVTDFVDPPWWPAFNLADAAITVGVVGLLLTMDASPEGEPA